MHHSRIVLLTGLSALLAAAPASAQVGFGASVTLGEGEIFVGEPGHELRPGLVYVFRRGDDDSWTLTQMLEAPDGTAGDRFGAATAFDGDRLLVSAFEADDGAGAVHAFGRSGGSWAYGGRLAVDASDGGLSVEAMAMDGEWALLGTPSANGDRGAVQVFRWEGGSWTHHSVIAAGDLVSEDLFGSAVALDGERAFASAPAKSNATGAIYAFRYDAGADQWRAAGRVGEQIQQQRTAFGSALAVVDGRVLVSGPGLLGVGAVVGFQAEGDSDAYQIASILLPFDGTGAGFGISLASSDGELWVGTANSSDGRGSAYVYRADEQTGEWVAAEKIVPAELSPGDAFGQIVAAGSGLMVGSALGEDYESGAAYLFERGEEGWAEVARLVGENIGPPAIRGEEVPCTAEGEASLFGCASVDLLSFLPLADMEADRGIRMNDVWGWTDPETGRDIVIAGMTNQAVFVDVSDPTEPVYLGRLPMTEGANAASWRDMKVYSDHVFVVADGSGEHGMQIFDLTRLREVDGSEPVTFDEDAIYRGVNEAHNIVINEETGFAYIVGAGGGGETCGGGLHMVDLRNPLEPTFAGCFADASTGRSSTGYTHDAQCVIYRGPDETYQGREICFGANETALSIADVTDKENPVALSTATYPNVAYSHQGWLSEDHRYFFTNDELDETDGLVSNTRTLVWDVAELEDPIMVKEYFSENGSSDHNLYIVGSTMYQSNYVSGLRVLDISDPENPVQVGYFDTVPYGEDAPGFSGSWSNFPFFDGGIVVVTSGREGLFVVRPEPRIVS